MTWIDAYKTCVSENADLVSIVDYDENDIVADRKRTYCNLYLAIIELMEK